MPATDVQLQLTDTFGTWKDKFNQAIGDINTAIDNVPSIDDLIPKNHASTATTYGVGNANNYGHLKLSDATNSTSGVSSGVAATPAAVKNAKDAAVAADTKAQNAQTAAQNADTKAQNAQTAAQNADTKAQNAQTAAQNADTKAQNADTKAQNAQTTANSAMKVFSGTTLAPLAEKFQALGNVTGSKAINLNNGLAISATITGATTFSFTNVAKTGATVVVMQLTNGGAYTITWPSSIKWAGGSAPKLTATGTDIIILTTNNSGTNWYGNVNLKYA